MEDILKELNDILMKRHTAIATVEYILDIRKKFMSDPVTTANSFDYSRGLSNSLDKFKEIFKTPNNIDLAYDDAAGILNSDLLASLDTLVSLDNAYKEMINSTLDKVDTKIAAYVSDVRHKYYTGLIDKAIKYLPYMETTEPKVLSKLAMIVSRDGIATTNALDWLYGITKDLDEENISDLFDTLAGMDIGGYVRDATGTPNLSNMEELVVVENGLGYKTLGKLSMHRDTEDNAVLLSKYIHDNLQSDREYLSTTPNLPKVDYMLKASTLQSTITDKLANDPLTILNPVNELTEAKLTVTHITHATRLYLNTVADIHNEVTKLLDTNELLVEIYTEV